MIHIDKFNNNNILCGLDMSPILNKPINKTPLAKLYTEIVKILPVNLSQWRTESKGEFEICDLNEHFLNDIIENANEEIGFLYEENYVGQKFRKGIKMTIRELFFQKIVEYRLSYLNPLSYNFLDLLTFSSGSYTDEKGNLIFYEPTPIKLSTLLSHRFDGDEYSFSEQCSSYISLKSSNLKFFTHVVRMIKYLRRKDDSFYNDYPQYFMLDNTGLKDLVEPMELNNLHRKHDLSCAETRDCTYYSNHWVGNKENKSRHSNAIMAILSYLKFVLSC